MTKDKEGSLALGILLLLAFAIYGALAWWHDNTTHNPEIIVIDGKEFGCSMTTGSINCTMSYCPTECLRYSRISTEKKVYEDG